MTPRAVPSSIPGNARRPPAACASASDSPLILSIVFHASQALRRPVVGSGRWRSADQKVVFDAAGAVWRLEPVGDGDLRYGRKGVADLFDYAGVAVGWQFFDAEVAHVRKPLSSSASPLKSTGVGFRDAH